MNASTLLNVIGILNFKNIFLRLGKETHLEFAQTIVKTVFRQIEVNETLNRLPTFRQKTIRKL